MNHNEANIRFVEACYRYFLGRQADAPGLLYHVARLESGTEMATVMNEFAGSKESGIAGDASQWVPPGHFYSPNPSRAEVEEFRAKRSHPKSFQAIDLQDDEQGRLLDEFAKLYSSIPFGDNPTAKNRYGYVNSSYPAGDSIPLHCFIRYLKPSRFIEVGCGNSTCATLDTIEQFLDSKCEVTLVEPYPEFLKTRVRPSDFTWTKLVTSRLQDVPLSLFETLQANDILFIDSTHVSKLESDVNYLFFELLPRLNKGVFIHIHDVFYPFEYPIEWLEEGRAWNEQYLLRTFLQYNETFKIRFFNTYLMHKHRKWFTEKMPRCLAHPGGSIWLEKVL